MSTKREPLEILEMALEIAASKPVHHVSKLLSIHFSPATPRTPNTLTIIKHLPRDVVVLQAIWIDNDERPPVITKFLGGAWCAMLRRAAQMQPQSILP